MDVSQIGLFLFFLCFLAISSTRITVTNGGVEKAGCGPGWKVATKSSNGTTSCERIHYNEFLAALYVLHHHPHKDCKVLTVKADFGVCEDYLPSYIRQHKHGVRHNNEEQAQPDNGEPYCVMWSIIASRSCNHLGSLTFEKYWSRRGCKVKVFHFVTFMDHKNCATPPGKLAGYENIEIIRQGSMTHYRYNWWFKLGILKYINELQKIAKTTPSAFNQSLIDTLVQSDIGLLDINAMDSFEKQPIHVLKIQGRDKGNDKIEEYSDNTSSSGEFLDFDGLAYYILSEWYYYHPSIIRSKFQQLVFSSSLNIATLRDSTTRGDQFIWNVWASQQFLSGKVNADATLTTTIEDQQEEMHEWSKQQYVNIRNTPKEGVRMIRPLQFGLLLKTVDLPVNMGVYHQTWVLIQNQTETASSLMSSTLSSERKFKDERKEMKRVSNSYPNHLYSSLIASIPSYCKAPSMQALEKMQEWIHEEIHVRCHPTQISVPCVRDRGYDNIIPCPQELMNALAEDYAISKNWCDFHHDDASIPPLKRVPTEATAAIQQWGRDHKTTSRIRLVFFFTVYTDNDLFERLFSHVYDAHHFYLIHIDPNSNEKSHKFQRRLIKFISFWQEKNKNVFVFQEIPIVYGSATASILLSRAMAWFNLYGDHWDYLITLTGTDYPLVPLSTIETILSSQKPPLPFIMAWSSGTSKHIFRLGKTHPIFVDNEYLQGSIHAVMEERGGKVSMGAVPMPRRSGNFGPPLICEDINNFHRLDNRRNKSWSSPHHDTQWLFPRDCSKNKGYAYAEDGTAIGTNSYDGQHRIWKKSDPATTAAYDRESIRYIIESQEGKKYYHFFKYMLLGSEEHYYISLLYNWPRTHAFVQTLSAQFVWNTWTKGLQQAAVLKDGFQTHTNYLSMQEFSILKGFAMRGMMFARKFHSMKTKDLLDLIDRELLSINGSISNKVGAFWPGYFEVDVASDGNTWKRKFNQMKPEGVERIQGTRKTNGKRSFATITSKSKPNM